MAYIGQYEGISRKQLVGYSPKGTQIFPLRKASLPTGFIILPTQTSCSIIREISENYQQHLHHVWPPKNWWFNDPCQIVLPLKKKTMGVSRNFTPRRLDNNIIFKCVEAPYWWNKGVIALEYIITGVQFNLCWFLFFCSSITMTVSLISIISRYKALSCLVYVWWNKASCSGRSHLGFITKTPLF